MGTAFSFRQIGLAAIVWLLGLAALASSVHAQLVLSIDQPNQFASPGSTVDFSGAITNDTGFDLDAATNLFVNIFNYDPTVFSPPPDQLLGNPDFTLLNGATSPDVKLFDVNIDSSATAAGSPYLADVTIGDSFGDLSNDVTISITVPEPGSILLLLTALALLIGFVNGRTRRVAFNRRLLRLALAGVALFWVGSAQAAVTPVQLSTLNGATSVWDSDATKVGVELQIGNSGSAAANSVSVTSLSVQGGTLSPGTLPIALGTINAGDDTMLDFVISVPTANGAKAYRLTISGTYTSSGKSYGFSLNWSVTPNSAGPGIISPHNGTAAIQNPATAIFPPAPVQPPFTPNAETPNFVPIGPPTGPLFTPTPTGTGVGPSTGGELVQIPINTTHGTGPGVPPDPDAAAEGGGVALATYNTGISYSTDGGKHFTDVNLFNPVAGRTSFFPQSDGGLCCDQVVVYVPAQNLFFWLQQYWPITACATNCGPPVAKNATFKITQPDRERIAWATPAAIKADFNNAWSYIDLTANSSVGSTGLGAANNEWVDYPDLAWSNTYLYFMVDHGFPTPGQVYTGQRIVARLSLADITNPAATVVNYQYALITGSSGLNKDHIAQQAPGKMVFASLDNSSTLRVFTWNDTDNTISNSTVGITSIKQGTNYTSVAPDGIDWLASSFPGNITGAVYRSVIPGLEQSAQDQYVFAFDAGVNGAGRPNSYVRLETLTPSGGGYSAIAEYDIWNSNYAFAMAALGRDNNDVSPDMGITLAVGGGTIGYPQDSVGFKDDFVVFQVTSSNATQSFLNANNTKGARFGDYFAARYIDGSDAQFAAEAYDVTLPAGSPAGSTCITVGCTATMRFIQFGRPPEIGPK